MTADDLEEHGAETGLVLEYNRGSSPHEDTTESDSTG